MCASVRTAVYQNSSFRPRTSTSRRSGITKRWRLPLPQIRTAQRTTSSSSSAKSELATGGTVQIGTSRIAATSRQQSAVQRVTTTIIAVFRELRLTTRAAAEEARALARSATETATTTTEIAIVTATATARENAVGVGVASANGRRRRGALPTAMMTVGTSLAQDSTNIPTLCYLKR